MGISFMESKLSAFSSTTSLLSAVTATAKRNSKAARQIMANKTYLERSDTTAKMNFQPVSARGLFIAIGKYLCGVTYSHVDL